MVCTHRVRSVVTNRMMSAHLFLRQPGTGIGLVGAEEGGCQRQRLSTHTKKGKEMPGHQDLKSSFEIRRFEQIRFPGKLLKYVLWSS